MAYEPPRNAMIIRDTMYLQAYSEAGGASWTEELNDAWHCDLNGKLPKRIAAIVGGSLVQRSDQSKEIEA